MSKDYKLDIRDVDKFFSEKEKRREQFNKKKKSKKDKYRKETRKSSYDGSW
jgi:hypothetical protein